MSDIGEALGTASEGALIARAVSPGDGDTATAKGHFSENACLNCGTPLAGPHCHACGQKAHLHRTLGAFVHDLIHGALHFEGKTWRTLPKLALKPGELTRRYIAGERAKFVSPMALFLFSIFLMFAVFQLAGISSPDELVAPGQVVSVLDDSIEGARSGRAEAVSRLTSLPTDDPGRDELTQRIADYDGEIAALERAGSGFRGKGFTTDLRTGSPFVDRGIEKWNANPSLMLYKLQNKSSAGC